MFEIEILQGIGVAPQRIKASQVVIRMPGGTPVAVAALFGGSQGLLVSHCKDAEFNSNLDKLGIREVVISTDVKL
jgi:hypothetical protein